VHHEEFGILEERAMPGVRINNQLRIRNALRERERMYPPDLHRRRTEPWMRGRSGRNCEARGFPVPRQQFGDPACRMIGKSCEHVGEPSLRIDVVEFASLNQ
jgi:hypothetical protein